MGGAEVDSPDRWVWETGVFDQDQIQEDWVQGGVPEKTGPEGLLYGMWGFTLRTLAFLISFFSSWPGPCGKL